jgi:hypothetical protein
VGATLIRKQSSFPQDGLLVHGPEKVARVDTLCLQSRYSATSVKRNPLVEHDPINPVDIFRIFCTLKRQLQERVAFQALMIPAANRALLAQSFRDSFKLRHANSGLNVAHPKIPTEFLMDEPSLFIEAQIAQIATSLRQLLVVG